MSIHKINLELYTALALDVDAYGCFLYVWRWDQVTIKRKEN